MKKLDKDGLILCDIQGSIFEKSLEKTSCSSEIFIRRFMNSDVSNEMDSTSFLSGNTSVDDVFDLINEKYGETNYGKNKFGKEALYWIGYIYRYFSYTYNLSSKQVYNIIKPKELAKRYYVYHTFDCAFAIERILEEIGVSFENPNERLLEFIKKKKYEENLSLNYESKLFRKNAKELKADLIYKDKVIGTVSFKKLVKKSKYLETTLSSGFTTNETLKETIVSKTLDFAKDILGLESVSIRERKDNEDNIRILTKEGFCYKDEDSDMICYSKKL